MATAESRAQAPPVRAHLLLPETDGSIVENFREVPQHILLTDSILPVLDRKHPDGMYTIGHDSGIYWKQTEPPLAGCKSPDWYYIPNVPRQLDGEYRRSYVLWEEKVPPAIILEFVSGDGSYERDRTPESGKFWVYEQMIRAPYYGIFDVETGDLEVFHLVEGRYQVMTPNDRGHYPIDSMGVELGVWNAYFMNEVAPWMRWWDDQGNLLLIGHEIAEEERKSAAKARQRAESERQRAESERQRAESERQRAESERQRAESERQRAAEEHQRAESECERAAEEHQRAEAAVSEVEHARRRAEALAARLRALGVNPDEI